ncbi:inactive rhomboid protein 1-like, partial [Trifolium pratense]
RVSFGVRDTFYTIGSSCCSTSIRSSSGSGCGLEAPPEAAAAQPLPLVERKYHPWLTGIIVVLYAAIFLVIMGINNCPKHTYPTKACFPYGRFSFQPADQNPLFGPSRATLIKMGGLYLRKVLHMHQAWSLFSNIWLHEGLSQLITDTVTLLGVGIPLERKHGFVRVALLYLISGLGGSILSALFIETGVTVGASGALAGLTGGSLSVIIIEYFMLHLDKGLDSLIAIVLMFANVAATVLQHGDNFRNIGGSIIGFGFGFVIFSRPPVNRLRRSAVLIVIIVGLLAGMVMLLKGVNLNDHCSWCHYLDCIPFPGWSCKYRGNECQSTEIRIENGHVLSLICKANGRTDYMLLADAQPKNCLPC